MSSEVQRIEASTCTCGYTFCGGAGVDCACGCCGPVAERSQGERVFVAKDSVIPLKATSQVTACSCGCCG